MAKIDLDSLSIEELASLRDAATEKLAQKVFWRGRANSKPNWNDCRNTASSPKSR